MLTGPGSTVQAGTARLPGPGQQLNIANDRAAQDAEWKRVNSLDAAQQRAIAQSKDILGKPTLSPDQAADVVREQTRRSQQLLQANPSIAPAPRPAPITSPAPGASPPAGNQPPAGSAVYTPSWVKPGDQYSAKLGQARSAATGELYGPP